MFDSWKLRDIVVGLACVTLAAGCDNGMALVEGQVTFDGASVDRGMISLEPVDGKGPSAGANVEKGRYVIPDVTPGQKVVKIYAVRVIGQKPIDPDIPDSPLGEVVEDFIPEAYNNKTTLKLDVSAPLTKHDFNLETPK